MRDSSSVPSEATNDDGAGRAQATLRIVRPLAIALLVGALLGRYFVPNIAGLVTGVNAAARPIEVAAGTLSQALAMIAEVSTISLVIAVGATRLRAPLRLSAIALGGFVILVCFSAARDRVPPFTAIPVGLAATMLAIGGTIAARNAPFAQPAARAVGAIALSSLFRLAALMAASLAPSGPAGPGALATVARVLATIALVADAIALILAMSFATRRARALFEPFTAVALGLALVATRFALGGESDDAGAASVLFHRIGAQLVPHPVSYLPLTLVLFVAFLAPIAAAAVLARRGPVPALGAAVALALLARGSPEVPLAALGLLIAGLALVLVGQDPKAMWSALEGERPSHEGPERGPRSEENPRTSDQP